MMSIECPSCKNPMGIDENDLNSEWECPECLAGFRVQKGNDDSLQFQITTAAADPTAIHAEPAAGNPWKSRRRRSQAKIEPATEEPDLNISLAPKSPWQDRFPDLEPAQPPSLFTINGVGVMMYGNRDHDAETGTYVTSACLVVLFVPIFVMSSYRVADAPAEGWFSSGGWHVLGKVPLSPLAKGYNWIMLAVVLLGGMMCLFSIR